MTDSERIMKALELDFEELVKDSSWQITPKDFLCNIKIILIENPNEFEMFIWNLDTEAVGKSVKFSYAAEITGEYSFLYNFNKKNLKNADKT